MSSVEGEPSSGKASFNLRQLSCELAVLPIGAPDLFARSPSIPETAVRQTSTLAAAWLKAAEMRR